MTLDELKALLPPINARTARYRALDTGGREGWDEDPLEDETNGELIIAPLQVSSTATSGGWVLFKQDNAETLKLASLILVKGNPSYGQRLYRGDTQFHHDVFDRLQVLRAVA